MDYVYGGMWLLIGLILIFSLTKENKIFYFVGAYFLILGGWWIANALMPTVNLFEGTVGIVFKGISVIALLVIAVFYYKNFWKPKHNNKDKGE